MSEPSVDLVGVRGNSDPFRSFSLGQSTQGRPTAIGGTGPSTPLSGMEALLTNSLAMQAQMVDELKTLATAAHANARNQGVGSAAGVTQSIGQQFFGGEALLSSTAMDPLAAATRASIVAAAAQSLIPSSTEQALSIQERGARRAAAAIPTTHPDVAAPSIAPSSIEQALSIQERGARLAAASLSVAPFAASELSSKTDGRVGPRFEGDPWARTDENSMLTIQQRAAESISRRLSSGGPVLRQRAVTSGFQFDDEKGWTTDDGEAASETAVMDQVASRTGGMRMDEKGRWYDTTDTGEATYLANEEARSRLEAGTENIDSEGNVVTGQALTRLRQGAAIRGGLQNAASTISQGGTVRGAASNAFNGMGVGNLAKGLGYAGAAIEVGTRVRDFANNQRAENASWQRVLGGSNAEGFGERMDQRMFSTAQNWAGGMDSAQADQLYAGAAAIHGTDTAGRSSAQDFGTKMWKELGIEVSESLEVIRLAARGGNDALLGVADALRNVTTSAREAGVNAEVARQAFTQQMTAAAPTLGSGMVTTQMSGFIASAGVALGPRFEGLTDFSPLASEQSISAIASQQRMDYAETSVALQNDSAFAAQATTQYIRSRSGRLGSDERIGEYVRNYQVENPAMEDEDWETLAGEIQAGAATDGETIDPRTVQTALAESLVVVPENLAVETMLRMIYPTQVENEDGEMTAIGTFNLEGAEAETSGGSEVTQNAAAAEALSGDAGIVGTERGALGAITELGAEATGNTRVHSLLEGEQGEALREVAEAIGLDGSADSIARAQGDVRDYLRRFMRTGERQPVLERILREGNLVTDESRFEVETGDDETRIVTFGELIRDYGDQGSTAEIVEGNNAGATTAESVGLNASDEEAATASAEATSGIERGGPNILGMGGYEETGSLQGSITIVAEPALRDALRFIGGGIVDQNSRTTGGPEPQPPVNNPRGTGN